MVNLLHDVFGVDFVVEDIKVLSLDRFPLITALILIITKKHLTDGSGGMTSTRLNLFKDIMNKILLSQKIRNRVSSVLV